MKRVHQRDLYLDKIDNDDIAKLNKQINHLEIEENENENDDS